MLIVLDILKDFTYLNDMSNYGLIQLMGCFQCINIILYMIEGDNISKLLEDAKKIDHFKVYFLISLPTFVVISLMINPLHS
jgi:hypothetical protein